MFAFLAGENIFLNFVADTNETSVKLNPMRYNITAPTSLSANIHLPSSKSISNRALIINALSDSGIMPERLSDCDDTDVMLRALHDRPQTIDIHAAGTAMRFLTAYLSATLGEHVLTGTERMKQRPIGTLVEALHSIGADIEYVERDGFPPLRIKGRPLDGGKIAIQGNISSQFVSALLMIGPALRNGLELEMKGGISSKPYIDLTLWMMREFGADADWSEADTVTVAPKPYTPRHYVIESDWSAASYWYEILALTSDQEATIKLNGLADGSKQGDSIVRYIFSMLGVKTIFSTKEQDTLTTITLRKQQRRLQRLDYDFGSAPDLAQTVVVTCAMMDIPFRFTGLASLRLKETDRIMALQNELRKVGYVLRDEHNDTLIWDGERTDPTAEPFETYDDHRMAMALAPIACKRKQIKMNNPQVVTKSYPLFWQDMKAAGFGIEEI